MSKKAKAHDLSAIRYEGGRDHTARRVAIVVSRWNAEITESLWQGAVQTLTEAGVQSNHILRVDVPGTYELAFGALGAMENVRRKEGVLPDAVICLGCVIQGETRHFEFISQAAAQGIMQVGLNSGKPVIFGVLTPDTYKQAQDRAGGKLGNKGSEAAVAALQMIDAFAS